MNLLADLLTYKFEMFNCVHNKKEIVNVYTLFSHYLKLLKVALNTIKQNNNKQTLFKITF